MMSIFFHHKHLICQLEVGTMRCLGVRVTFRSTYRGDGENVDCYVESRDYKFKSN